MELQLTVTWRVPETEFGCARDKPSRQAQRHFVEIQQRNGPPSGFEKEGMSTSSSSIPAPDPGSGVQLKLPPSSPMRPSVLPPKQRPDSTTPRRRTALWGTLIALTLLAGGAAYHLN